MKIARAIPLAVIFAAASIIAFGARSPTLLTPELSWAPPTFARPLGSGEAGVDLTALVAHATQRAVLLATCVALVGFLIGSPLGAAAGLARGRFERGVARACDLVQA